jgi:L-threonylcarbamoyladenylate synthase
MPRVLHATDDAIAQAVALLRRGRVVAIPTETVYGLAADTFNPAAIERVFALKGRPFNNPLIAHVLDWKQAARLTTLGDDDGRDSSATRRSSIAHELARRFWPGPLTLVLPRAADVPGIATAGLETIAIRCPSHPAARSLLEAFGGPLSAPSANRSGSVSPTTAAHVARDFAEADDLLILDGGPCDVGIESTVLDLTASPSRVLRPGGVTIESLRAALGEVEAPIVNEQAGSPGTSPRHYAPRTPAMLVKAEYLREVLSGGGGGGGRAVVLCFDESIVPAGHEAILMPRDPREYAARLYDALRQADARGAGRIVIEQPRETSGLWAAIHDRLRRASAAVD